VNYADSLCCPWPCALQERVIRVYSKVNDERVMVALQVRQS
jgi:hypothetical protein